MVVYFVSSPLLSIVPAGLEISRVLPTTEDVTIEAGLARSVVNCPDCGQSSRRLHSLYPRVLRDLPWQGRPAMIRVTARRFRCLNSACARKTFAELSGAVAPASARRTARLGDLQRHVAFALGGEAAARLAGRLAIPTSADTLLRMATKPVAPETPPPTPKVLGVDDWAKLPKVPSKRGKSVGKPHFFLAPIRRRRVFASCAATLHPFDAEPSRS